MRDQLSALEELQKIDLELSQIEENLKKYPLEISEYNTELETLKNSIILKKQELDEITNTKESMEQNLKDNLDLIKKAEDRLFEIKTHKEYEALQKEIGETKRNNLTIEENILSEMETIETLENSISEEEEKLKEKEKDYGQKIDEYENKISLLKEDYKPKKVEKDNIVSKIKPEILPVYERVKKRNGVVIARVENEICTGCNMNIPPQLYNEVLKLTRIIQCPNCKKILSVPSAEPSQD